MYVRKAVFSAFHLADSLFTRLYLGLCGERNALLVFLFHGMAPDEKAIDPQVLEPERIITSDQFRQFIEYYLDYDYIFISPQDVIEGLDPDRKYILITFDDGYFNNHLSLPLLQEYKVPAVFFISTDHVKQNKNFWWDVLFRMRFRQGCSYAKISREQGNLKSKTNAQIEEYLIDEFGEDALKPVGDLDRPFSPQELRDFSNQEFVYVGNHTCDHAILANYPDEEIRLQIEGAQRDIQEMTGRCPTCIAYPDGSYSKRVAEISEEAGLRLGFTTNYGKNYFPLKLEKNSFLFKRVGFSENSHVLLQCQIFRSDFSLKYVARGIYRRLLRSGY
jgi:peptidoglycan/xylan/chitin deacetylase (PgdA/CDA1 family)